jgi:pimeloyl-ACP methyl ester carboxylesterase
MIPNINFKIIGQGQPIIILHGLFGMLDNWLNIAKKLESSGFMPILIDQRDHGRSDRTDDFNYRLLANDLAVFMEENWIHDAILLGHSMGGKTVLQYMADHDSGISKSIIVDIGLKKYKGGHQEIFDALFAVDLENAISRMDVENVLSGYLKELGTVQFLMKNLTRKRSGGFEWKMNLDLLFKNYQHILDGIHFDHPIETPTLFIRGDQSDYILDEDWPEILENIPNAKLKSIKNAGHWVHADQPDELFKLIIDYI